MHMSGTCSMSNAFLLVVCQGTQPCVTVDYYCAQYCSRVFIALALQIGSTKSSVRASEVRSSSVVTVKAANGMSSTGNILR